MNVAIQMLIVYSLMAAGAMAIYICRAACNE